MLGSAWAIVSCGDKAQSPSARPLRFAWIAKASGASNAVFAPGPEGAQQRAQEISARGEQRVEVVDLSPASEAVDALTQTAALQEAIDAGVDGIAISVGNAAAQTPLIDEAVARGIQVITFDSDAPASRRQTYYSLDNRAAGAQAAQLLAAQLGDEGEVAVLTSDDTAPNIVNRAGGFVDEIALHPDIRIVATIKCRRTATVDGVSFSGPDCSQDMDAVIAAHPDIRGWFFAAYWGRFMVGNGEPVRSPTTGQTSGKRQVEIDGATAQEWRSRALSGAYRTVAIDAVRDALDFARVGAVASAPDGQYLQAMIGQKYWGWGYDTIGILHDLTTGRATYDSFTPSGTDVVCANNVEQHKAAWAALDFTVPVPRCSLLP
jgi:ribose transport system substrate-binding protein